MNAKRERIEKRIEARRETRLGSDGILSVGTMFEI
jgi:hypothetical protein